MTAATGRARTAGSGATVAARAVLAALLAVVTTFWPQPDRTAAFGLVVLGGYLVLQAAVLAIGLVRRGRRSTGVTLLLARVGVSLTGGVLALTGTDRGTALLLPLEALVFLLVGGLEIVGGLVAPERAGSAGDAVVVGGLQVVVGLLLVILSADRLFAVGILSAWGAVVAVYLGIAAVHLRRGDAVA